MSDRGGGGGVENCVENLLGPDVPESAEFEQGEIEQAGESDAVFVVRPEEFAPVEIAAKPRQKKRERFGVPLVPERKRRAPSANEPKAGGEDEQRGAAERKEGETWSRHAPESRQRGKVRRRIWRSSQMLQFSM